MMVGLLLISTSFLALAVTANATTYVEAGVTRDQYGALCAGVDTPDLLPGYVVVCAGKGVLVLGPPLDCVAYVDNTYVVAEKLCV
jgi:hypothetical protein